VVSNRSNGLTESIRRQILQALEGGMWKPGARLPSTREMAAQLGVDPRAITRAYKQLAAEELVELRPRSGAYISDMGSRMRGATIGPPENWIVEVMAESIAREIPAGDIGEWLRRAVETVRLRAFVTAPTIDQVLGLKRELGQYYGLETSGVPAEQLARTPLPLELRQADLVIATDAAHELALERARVLGLPCIRVTVRLDIAGPAWQSLTQSPGYVVVSDERFGRVVAAYLSSLPGATKVHLLVAGRDDVEAIPEDAVVYVTRSAREELGDLGRIKGRVLPPVRLLSQESSVEILKFMVAANLAALRVRQTDPTRP
jgi:DNA-binding transcriptional regulator YhcF (GntR family)